MSEKIQAVNKKFNLLLNLKVLRIKNDKQNSFIKFYVEQFLEFRALIILEYNQDNNIHIPFKLFKPVCSESYLFDIKTKLKVLKIKLEEFKSNEVFLIKILCNKYNEVILKGLDL